MNSKAIRKQLLAAVAMVLVAAVALGSSTYAWFVQNSEVKATGMAVQAQAEKGIEITYKGSNTWGSVATSSAGTDALYPTSTNDVTNWYHAKADASTASTGVMNTYEKLTLGTDGKSTVEGHTTEQYFQLTEFTLRSTSSTAATNLTIKSVEATKSGEVTPDLDKALRVAVVIDGEKTGTSENQVQKVHIFAPFGGNSTYNIWDGSSTTAVNVAVKTESHTTAQATTISVPQTGVGVKIYAWYEGEDTNLKSANLPTGEATIDTMNITVNFTATV